VIRTDDIFLGAFALSRGGDLSGVEVQGVNGRRVAYFHIDGPDAAETQRDYYQGPAVVHLQILKASVRRLKDAAFEAIRAEERNHEATGEPGSNRHHQAPGRYRRGNR